MVFTLVQNFNKVHWNTAFYQEKWKQKFGKPTHDLAVTKIWKWSLKESTGWKETLEINLFSASSRIFKYSSANRLKCFVKEFFSGNGCKNKKSTGMCTLK